MAAMSFTFNGILPFQDNLRRVTQVVFQMYRNFIKWHLNSRYKIVRYSDGNLNSSGPFYDQTVFNHLNTGGQVCFSDPPLYNASEGKRTY